MKPHILVVDDSMTVRMDLRGSLTAAGFDVTLCDSKRAADLMLKERRFAAALLDVMLPDGDGTMILRDIRTNSAHTEMPVIMLSTEAEVQDRIRGLSLGADEYVGKPYDIAYVIRCLRALCRRSRTSAAPPPPVGMGRRILAVDDSVTFLTALARVLREDGHDVVLARSGEEGLEMLAAQTIDCIVLDLHMPGINGIETLRRIRQTAGRESTPTLMLTGSDDPRDESCAMAAGVDEFVHKTAALDSVRAKIRGLLRRKHAEGRAAEGSGIRPVDFNSRFKERFVRRDEPRSSQTFPARASCFPAATTANSTQSSSVFSSLFVEVASAMGFNADLSRDSLARTLRRMNIDPCAMTRADLLRALPSMQDTLAMFYAPEDAAQRGRALSAIAEQTGHSVAV